MPDEVSAQRKYLLVLGVISVLALLLRVYGLAGVPPSDDDLQVLSSATNYMVRGHFGQTMWQHPKLRNILVYWSCQIFGGSVWGLKGVSLCLGTASVPLIAAVTRRLLHSKQAALIAAFFLAIDPLHIDFSRQAVQEVYMPFFVLAGICAAWRYRDGGHAALLLVAGACFGLGFASKWYVAFPQAATAAFLMWEGVRKPVSRGAKLSEGAYLICTLLLLPGLVYLLTYLPWLYHQGFDLSEWFAVQRLTYQETVTHLGFSPYDLELDHSPSHWFMKPVAYADFVFAEGRPWVLLAIPNPFVWLLTLPAMGYFLWRGAREKRKGDLFLVGSFGFTYLPLLVSDRPIWVHTAFSVLPFALMAVGCFLTELMRGKRWRSRAVAAYLVVATVAAAPLYLLAVGRGEEIPVLRSLLQLYRPANESN